MGDEVTSVTLVGWTLICCIKHGIPERERKSLSGCVLHLVTLRAINVVVLVV